MPELPTARPRRLLHQLGSAWSLARLETKLLAIGLILLVVLTALVLGLRPGRSTLIALYAPLFGALYATTLRRLRFDWGTVVLLLGAYGLYLAYLGYTNYGERNYDAGAQLEYIRYIVERRSLPAAEACFVCHHPPAYYAASALPYAFFAKTKLASPAFGVQLFSLGLFLVFVVASVSLVRLYTSDPWRIRLAAALVAYWPYSVHNAVRVHNDSLVSTLMVLAFFFVVRWQRDDRPRDLYLASGVIACALLTKSSAYVLVATLLVVLGHRLYTRGERRAQLARAAIVAVVLATAMFANTLRKGDRLPEGTESSLVDRRGALCQKLLGSACDIHPREWVANRPFNYLWFDLRSFLAEPYVLSDRDETGRQFFWNHLAQSSLFGTHNKVADRETAYELNANVAVLMHALTVGMMGFLGVSFLLLDRARLRRYAVPLLGVGFFIAFAMAFRVLVPAPHHSDFRHVFPVMSLLSLAYANAVGFHARRRSVLQHVGLALAIPFLALSVFYFWPKHDWADRVSARTVRVELSAYGTPVREGTPWDRRENLVLESNHTIEALVSPARSVSGVDLSLDHNDVYELRLQGADGERLLRLGPKPRQRGGLSRYQESLAPPLEGVKRVTLRPVRGDRAYAMGHLVLRSPEPPSPARAPATPRP